MSYPDIDHVLIRPNILRIRYLSRSRYVLNQRALLGEFLLTYVKLILRYFLKLF